MRISKLIIATFFVIIGAVTVVGELIMNFTDFFPEYKTTFGVSSWGIISGTLLFCGAILLYKNSKYAILALSLSIVFYFLGGIIPMWPKYGINTFHVIMNAFYYSIAERLILSGLAIYFMIKEIAVNKALKSQPSAAEEAASGAP